MKNKNSLKIISFGLAILLVLIILIISDIFTGNPISKHYAIITANDYFSKNYGDTDFVLHDVVYKIEGTQYYFQIDSPSSIDTKFHLKIDRFANIKRDSYERDVLSGNTTWGRCEIGYNELVEDVFTSPDFPYEKSNINSNSGWIPFYNKTKDIDMSILKLDQNFDYKDLGKKYGEIVFTTTSQEVTIEEASKILLDLTRIFDEKEVYFNSINFSLNNVNGDNNEQIQLYDFLYTDIYKEGLEERIKSNMIN